MLRHIQAIYDKGLLRPLEPLVLRDQQVVTLSVDVDAPADAPERSALAAVERQQTAWAEFLRQMAALAEDGVQDGLSNRDHDAIIYGG